MLRMKLDEQALRYQCVYSNWFTGGSIRHYEQMLNIPNDWDNLTEEDFNNVTNAIWCNSINVPIKEIRERVAELLEVYYVLEGSE